MNYNIACHHSPTKLTLTIWIITENIRLLQTRIRRSKIIDHSFNFADSVLNTPSSSLATLNSSATTYINSSSCSTEDEIESYFSNFLKFDIPDFLDINGFII
ncbi:hypothetical protein YC2023_041399 [Brassica napus]